MSERKLGTCHCGGVDMGESTYSHGPRYCFRSMLSVATEHYPANRYLVVVHAPGMTCCLPSGYDGPMLDTGYTGRELPDA